MIDLIKSSILKCRVPGADARPGPNDVAGNYQVSKVLQRFVYAQPYANSLWLAHAYHSLPRDKINMLQKCVCTGVVRSRRWSDGTLLLFSDGRGGRNIDLLDGIREVHRWLQRVRCENGMRKNRHFKHICMRCIWKITGKRHKTA